MKATIQRHAQNDSEFRGKVQMSIEINDESFENQITEAMKNEGFTCLVVEETDHYEEGSSLVYWMDSHDVDYFKLVWKNVKKGIK